MAARTRKKGVNTPKNMARGGLRPGAGRKKVGDKKPKVSPTSLANLKAPWQPGVSPNPKGRPKGSRNKLGEDFLSDLQADWATHGADAIVKMRENNPADYVKVVAGILPKELNVKTSVVEEMSDDELAAGIAALQSLLTAEASREGEGAQTKH